MEKRPKYENLTDDPPIQGGGRAGRDVGRTVRKIGRAARDTGEKLAREFGPVAKKVGRTIGEGVGIAAVAARKSARVVGIRAQIAAAEAGIARLYGRIGEAHYKGLKDPAARAARTREIKPLVEKVDGLHEKIADLKAQEKAVRAGA